MNFKIRYFSFKILLLIFGDLKVLIYLCKILEKWVFPPNF